MPKISVIVPVYNVEKYLERCVLSLVEQNFDDYDVLLIDDGSTDNSSSLCDFFAEKYEKVRSFHKQNGGLGDARNYGVSTANSEYIAFVDSDDFVEKSYLSDLYKLIISDRSEMSSSLVVRETEDGHKENPCASFEPFCLSNNEALVHLYSGLKCGWEACGKLFKKSLLLNNPFPSGLYEDVAVMYKIVSQCTTVSFCDCRNNYHYIVRRGSLLSNSFSPKNYRAFEICDEFSSFIKSQYPSFSFLVPIMYKRFLVVMFNMSSMSKQVFNELFYKYRPIFRRNYREVKKCGFVSFKDRLYFKLLSSTPTIYKMVTGLMGKRRCE